MDSETLAQRITVGNTQQYITVNSSNQQQYETQTVTQDRSPSRYYQRTINTNGTPRQTVIQQEKVIRPLSPSQQVSYINQQYTSPQTQIQANTRQIVYQGQAQVAGKQYISQNELPVMQATQIQQQLSQYGQVVREGNKFIVKQQIPQTVQIQEKIVEIEKPVYYEKQVYVENREEIESLKLRILQLEKTNQDYYLEITSLRNRPIEIQTQEKITYVEDSSKIRELEIKIQRLLTEIESVNQVIRSQKEEIEIYRKKYFDLESTTRQNAELTINYQREIDFLRSKLNEAIQERDSFRSQISTFEIQIRDFDSLRNRLNIVQDECEKYKSDNSRLLEQLFKYESRIKEYSLIEDEQQRLVRLIEQRESEIRDWSNRYSSLEVRTRELQEQNLRVSQITVLETDNRKLIELLEQKKREIDDWTFRFRNLEKEFSSETSKYRGYEERFVFLTTELERYKSLYQKNQDIEIRYKDYDVKIRDYESRIQFLRVDYEEKARKLVDEIGKLNQALRYKTEEAEGLRVQLKQSESRYYEFNTLSQENKRITELLSSRSREVDELRIRLTQFDQKILQTKEYEGRISRLSEEIERYKSGYNSKLIEIEELKRNLSQSSQYERVIQEQENRINVLLQEKERYQSSYSIKLREFDEIRIRYSEYESRIRDYELKITQLTQDNERLQTFYKERSSEIQSLRQSLTKTSEYEVKVREFQKSIEFYRSENDNLKQRIYSLTSELEEIRSRQSQFQLFQGKLREYEERISYLITECDKYKVQASKSIEYENKLVLVSTQIEALNSKVIMKEREIESLRSRYITEIEEWKQKSYRITQYDEQIIFLQRENERLKTLNTALLKDAETYRLNSAQAFISRSSIIDDQNITRTVVVKQLEGSNEFQGGRSGRDYYNVQSTSRQFQSGGGNGTVLVSGNTQQQVQNQSGTRLQGSYIVSPQTQKSSQQVVETSLSRSGSTSKVNNQYQTTTSVTKVQTSSNNQ